MNFQPLYSCSPAELLCNRESYANHSPFLAYSCMSVRLVNNLTVWGTLNICGAVLLYYCGRLKMWGTLILYNGDKANAHKQLASLWMPPTKSLHASPSLDTALASERQWNGTRGEENDVSSTYIIQSSTQFKYKRLICKVPTIENSFIWLITLHWVIYLQQIEKNDDSDNFHD